SPRRRAALGREPARRRGQLPARRPVHLHAVLGHSAPGRGPGYTLSTGEPSMPATEHEKRGFLRENWIYIVAPIVLVIVLLGALYLFGGGSEASPFIYNIF